MIRNKQKGQGLVEFALILPILLLLLLGIIEGGRIIWAYITVQNASREAARYAVAGRPLSCRGDPVDPETGDPGDPSDPSHFCDDSARGGDPWSNDISDIVRVEAIERIALDHGRNLTGDLLQASRVGVAGYNAGKTIPGKFGVLVIGQDGDHPDGAPNIPGKPGWNVKVQTYYNVKMLDPIYDTLLSGQVVHLQGEVELQNEGIDAANQGNYSGSISYNESNCPPDCGSLVATPYIIVQDAFGDMAEDAGSTFTVYAEDHLPNQNYELCLEGVTTTFAASCISFQTNNLGSAAVTYVIPVAAERSLPAGTKTYRIYTRFPAGDEEAACAAPATACFEITGVSARISASNIGDKEQEPPVRWPISSSIPIYLYGHDPNSSFPLTFDPAGTPPGALRFQGGPVTQIPTNDQGTNQNNDPAYYIATGHTAGELTISSGVVSTTVQLTNATADIAGEYPGKTHPQDDILSIVFRGLAPQQDYSINFGDGVTPPVNASADAVGDIFTYYVVSPGILKPDGTPYEPGQPATPVDIEVFDRNRGANPNVIVGRTFQVYTPLDPYLNVPGGSRWPAGSPITIQGRQHTAGHYYEVRIEQGDPGSPTFSEMVDGVPDGGVLAEAGSLNGEFDLSHIIPITYAAGFYYIRSYDVVSPTVMVAEFPIEVSSEPSVVIKDGERWPPNSIITIWLTAHAAFTPYELWLDPDNVFGQRTKIVDTAGRDAFVTNEAGFAELTYHIPVTMPTRIEPGYDLHSFFGLNAVADNAQLEVQPADLQVTRIELPDPIVDVYVPVRVTVVNSSPVTITNTYFDTDMYIDPGSRPNLGSIVPPGEYKTWVDSIGAYGSITLDEEIVLYGPQSHQIYGRTDTSDNLVELSETNNMLLYSVPAACLYEVADDFENESGDCTVDANWTQTSFGNGGLACPVHPDLPAAFQPEGNTLHDITWPYNDGNLRGFTIVSNPFDASEPENIYSGTSTTGNPFSSLYVGPRAVSGTSNETSAGASIQFTNAEPEVIISFDWRLRLGELDSNDGEWGEYYVKVDNTYYDGTTSSSTPIPVVRRVASQGDSAWGTFTLELQPTPGVPHTLTIGAKASPMDSNGEWVLAYIDNLLINEQDPSASTTPPVVSGNVVGEFHFNGAQSFSFSENTFLDTDSTRDNVVDSDYDPDMTAFPNTGSLYVQLGRDGSDPQNNASFVSGGWTSPSFNVTGNCVTVQGYYRINFPYNQYDGGEQSQVLVSIDDGGATPYILESRNGGDTGTDDSGWVPFNLTIPTTPGSHTITLGGFNNRSDSNGEVTDIWFDDIYIVDNGTGVDNSLQSEDGGVLTISNSGADHLYINDNAINPVPAGYHLMHRGVGSGPFELMARLEQPPATPNGEAGLEIRANTSSNAAKLMFTYGNDQQLRVYSRASNAYALSERIEDLGHAGPIWLRIQRNGNQFTFDYSTVNSESPPSNWNSFELVTFTLPDTVEAGLINAPKADTVAAAQFKHFHLCASSSVAGSTPGEAGNYLGNRCGQVEEAGHGLVVIDAINSTLNQSGYGRDNGTGTGTWEQISHSNVLGEPTMVGLQAELQDAGDVLPSSVGDSTPPHLQYEVNFESGGTYYLWVAGRALNSGRDSVHVGINTTAVDIIDGFPQSSTVAWVQMPGSVTINANSINSIHLWARQDNVQVFKILLTQDPDFIPPPDGMSQSACSIIVPPHIPPNLQQCTNAIELGTFEGTFAEVTSVWQAQGQALVYGTTSRDGNRGAAFPAFGGRFPAVYQNFELPTWMLENTNAILKLDKAVSWRGPGDSYQNPDDILYFSLRRRDASGQFTFDLIPPVQLATGADSPNIDPNLNPPEDWRTFNADIFNGLDPLSFVEPGDELRAYIYARNSDGATAAEDTAFYLDNISLTFCTTQPEPEIESGTGRLSGRATRFGQPLVGATIWAYATVGSDDYEPGPVFKTYSIQDGSYSFYNLPPGQYLIYATITDPNGTFFDDAIRLVHPDEHVRNVNLAIEKIDTSG